MNKNQQKQYIIETDQSELLRHTSKSIGDLILEEIFNVNNLLDFLKFF